MKTFVINTNNNIGFAWYLLNVLKKHRTNDAKGWLYAGSLVDRLDNFETFKTKHWPLIGKQTYLLIKLNATDFVYDVYSVTKPFIFRNQNNLNNLAELLTILDAKCKE